MTAHLGMRGAGEHYRLTEEGKRLHQMGAVAIQQLAMSLNATTDVQHGQVDELMFGARFYVCRYCGTKYESLPTLQGAVKCRNCGSNSMKEE